jgi:hypothetical protein
MDTEPVYLKCFNCCIKKIIEARAFEIWGYREANGIEGTAEEDYLEAERETMIMLANRQTYEKEAKKT